MLSGESDRSRHQVGWSFWGVFGTQNRSKMYLSNVLLKSADPHKDLAPNLVKKGPKRLSQSGWEKGFFSDTPPGGGVPLQRRHFGVFLGAESAPKPRYLRIKQL